MFAKSFGRAGLIGAALAASLIVGACQGSTVTPQPTPAPTDTATPAPTDPPTAAPTDTPAPTPEVTVAPTDTPAPQPTDTPSATLPPGVVACTGSASTKQAFANQVSHLKFALYCAVLPAGWSVVNFAWDYNAGGFQVHYHSGSKTLNVWEGNVCMLSPNPCTGVWDPDLGSQAFGTLTGDLSGSAGHYSTLVYTSNPKVLYSLTGDGMTVAQFKSYSAAMHKFS